MSASDSTTTDTNTTISFHPTIMEPKWDPSSIPTLLQKYPPKMNNYTYGTAGFRFDASVMDAVLVRVGIFCVWWYIDLKQKQQKQTSSGSSNDDNNVLDTIGIMVTASHNDESYNGVKLVDPKGEILANDEVCQQLTDYVNGTNETVQSWIDSLQSQSSPPPSSIPTSIIHVGHDTRSHSPTLTSLAVTAIQSLGGQVIHHGVTTTPLLHHVVAHENSRNVPSMIPIRPHAIGYYHLLAWSYLALLRTSTTTKANVSPTTTKTLIVDCACGVGYPSIEIFNKVLNEIVSPSSNSCSTPTTTILEPINGPTDGILNEQCGSEYVLKVRGPPKDYASVMDSKSWVYGASFDGDADRIAFLGGSDGDVYVFDGDKITTVVCAFLQTEVAALKESCASSPTLSKESLTLGAVQTAYANGASTTYLRNVLGESNVLIAKTGVRHCHHAAKHFDIGVYFEANGHGTVIFGPRFYSYLAQAETYFMETEQPRPKALLRLRVLPSLINQAVGDALSDLLFVDAILHIKGWDLQHWNSLYTDLPSRMTKMKVNDRSVVKTNENDTICLAPDGVQKELDAAMAKTGGRAFVRPSGTEDVVRVYAEAPTPDACAELSATAEDIVYRLCGGAGDPPQKRQKVE